MAKSFYDAINKRAENSFTHFFSVLTDCGFVKARTKSGQVCKKFRLFGRTLFTAGNKKRPNYDPAKPTVYLKVNRIASYTLNCIQRWLNILNGGGRIQLLLCMR